MKDTATMKSIMMIVDSTLSQMTHGTLSRTSSIKPRSFTPELMDTVTEFLAKALCAVEEEALQKQIAATVTRFASVRGDFRYQVAHSPCQPRTKSVQSTHNDCVVSAVLWLQNPSVNSEKCPMACLSLNLTLVSATHLGRCVLLRRLH